MRQSKETFHLTFSQLGGVEQYADSSPDFVEKPCAGVGPPPFGGGFGNTEDFNGLVDLQPDESSGA